MHSSYQILKLWVLAVIPLTKDAIHIYIGFLCLLPAVLLSTPRPRFAGRDVVPIALLGIAQFGVLIIVPLSAILVAQFTGSLWFSSRALAALGVALLGAWGLLLLVSVAMFERESILTRWR